MILRFFLCFLLTSIAFAAPAQRSVTLAVERPWYGLPQINVTLNDRVNARFIVDSAASETVLTDAVIERLNLVGQGVSAQVNGSTGSTPIHYYRLDSLALGTRSFRRIGAYGFPALASPIESDGLVGADVLRRHVVEFDLPGGTITLHGRRHDILQFSTDDTWDVVPVRQRRDGFLMVEVQIGRLTLPALIDTGASQSFVNEEAARQIGLRFVPDSESQEGVTGASGHVQTVNQIDLSTIRIGDSDFGPSRIGVADLAIFRSLGLDGAPAMILSANALDNRRFVLDYPRDRLLLELLP